MVTAVDVPFQRSKTERIPLIEGSKMRCPRCRALRNILDFQMLEMPVEFEDDLTPIYKCKKKPAPQGHIYETIGCGYLFAPAESAIKESMVK